MSKQERIVDLESIIEKVLFDIFTLLYIGSQATTM